MIGRFLEAHALEPSATSLSAAWTYLSRSENGELGGRD